MSPALPRQEPMDPLQAPLPPPAREERMEQLQALLHAPDLLPDRRPVGAKRRFIERLARADAEIGPPGEEPLQSRPCLRDQDRVVPGPRRAHPGSERNLPRGVARRSQPDPGVAGLAALPPGLE